MLCQILHYIKINQGASNQQIAREFQLTLSALQPMLDIWVKKGQLTCQQKFSCQKACVSCNPGTLAYYTYKSLC